MKYRLGELIESISKTYDLKNKESVTFVNTGDVFDGSISGNETKIKDLPGQAKKSIELNDILFSEIRPKNKRFALVTGIDPKNYVVSTKLMVLRNKNNLVLDTNYLYFYLTSPLMLAYFQSEAESRSGTFPQITFRENVANIKIDLPPLIEQRKIVQRLSVINDKVKLNNQINDNLVELINLIYLKFCADFPAKEKVSLDDVFNTSTKTFNVNENKNINIWHFSIPNFDCNKQPQCESTNSIKSNKKKVNSFGVLVSKLNPNFKRIWAPNLDFYSNYSPIASPEFIQINGNSQEEQALIFCILNSKEFTDFLVSNATGSTNSRQRVKPKIAVSYIIPFDLDKKKGLESLVSPILKDIQQREFENTKLQIIKDTLLNKYF